MLRRSLFAKMFLLYTSTVVCAYAEGGYLGANYGTGISTKPIDYEEGAGAKFVKKRQLKNSQVFGLALGYRYTDNVRLELAANHFHNYKYDQISSLKGDSDSPASLVHLKQKISADAIFGNVYLDSNKLSPASRCNAYFGLGAGVSQNDAHDFSLSVRAQDVVSPPDTITLLGQKRARFAWSATAGVAYRLNDKVTLDLVNLKYYSLGRFSTEKNSTGDSAEMNFDTYVIGIGARLEF